MKKFFQKIIAGIMAAYNWFVGLLNKVRRDRIYHFIAGLIIAAFFFIILKMNFCVWPVLFVAFIKEFIDNWQDGNFDWIDLLATVIGGLVIQLLVVLHLYVFIF